MFLPFGLPSKGVIDPEQQMRDFSQALSLLQQIDQHRFRENTFNDQDQLKNEFATIMTCSTDVVLGATSAANPVLTKASGKNFYHVPYNRGLEEVTMVQDWPEWSSPYPELVLAAFSWQWCRDMNSTFGGDTTVNVRLQMRLSIDGAFQPGTGPMTFALDGLYRGAGLGERSAVSVCKAIAVVPAGVHRVSAFAGQAPALTVTADDENGGVTPLDNPPTDRIVLGRRGMVLMRCAVGAGLTG
jgi:hypothetical protein